MKGRKELPSLALANLKLSPKLQPFSNRGLVTEGSVKIWKARKELAWLALANLKLSPGLQVKRGRRHQGVSLYKVAVRRSLAAGE